MTPRWTGSDWAVLTFLILLAAALLASLLWFDFVMTRAAGWGDEGTVSAAFFRWGTRWPWLPWVALAAWIVGGVLLWLHLFYRGWPFGGD